MTDLTTWKLGIANKIAMAFEIAGEKGYHPVEFSIEWLKSDVNKRLLEGNCNDVAGSPLYQIESFEIERNEKNIVIKPDGYYYPDEMFWAGYLFAKWQLDEDITGEYLVENYDIEWILSTYDTFHTLSIEGAIERIKEYHFEKEENKDI